MGPGGHYHPVRVVRIFDAKRTQVLVTASQGPFDGTVADMQHRNLGHPLLTAPVARRHFSLVQANKPCHRAASVGEGHHAHGGAPLSMWRDNDPVKQILGGDVGAWS